MTGAPRPVSMDGTGGPHFFFLTSSCSSRGGHPCGATTHSPAKAVPGSMRRLPATSLDLMKFVQAIGVGLRAQYADVACAPVPEYLLALVRELNGDQTPPTPISCDVSPLRKFGSTPSVIES